MAAWQGQTKKVNTRAVHGQITVYVSVFACFPHLAELLSVCVGQECFEGLEAGVDALHAPAFVAVGNLTADSSLLVLGRLRAEGDVGQAGGERSKGRDDHYSVHEGFVSNEKV